jgi:hypothetical protein
METDITLSYSELDIPEDIVNWDKYIEEFFGENALIILE